MKWPGEEEKEILLYNAFSKNQHLYVKYLCLKLVSKAFFSYNNVIAKLIFLWDFLCSLSWLARAYVYVYL